MLRRLYIDNFKSLVNFDLELGRTHLLLGRNGAGKSAIFTVLTRLKRFLLDESGQVRLFTPSTCTRWEHRTRQTFEFAVDSGDDTGAYQYRLEVDFIGGTPCVVLESLALAGTPLFRREENSVRLYRSDGTLKPGEFLVHTQSSALPSLTGRLGNAQLDVLRRRLRRMHVVSINPSSLRSASPEESPVLDDNLRNFASWYRHLAQEQPDNIHTLQEDLRQLFGPEFRNLRLARSDSEQGSTRLLRTEWRGDPADGDTKFELDFDELSDGQRMLICLYALLRADADQPTILCIDEPDNFVALSEIQPWLSALAERPNLQTLLISHHPEVINLGAEDALYFYRRGQGPTRVKKFQELVHPDETLTAAELVARGWIDADS